MLQINNLSSRLLENKAQITKSIERVIDSGWLVLGPEVKRFEQNFASYLNINHCIGTANGTDAIQIALKGAGVKRGDLVATVANAGMYSTTAIINIGAQPFYIDVDLNTQVVNFENIAEAVKAGVKAIIVTHLYGLAISEIAKIADYCRQQNIFLLEDCAQAHGAKIDDKFVGTFGDAASFSFYPTKNLGALGDAGAIVTNNKELDNKIRKLCQYGWKEKYNVDLANAQNSRLDEIQAAILIDFLPHLDLLNTKRRAIANKYNSGINHSDISTPNQSGAEYVAHLYVIRTKKRESLREYLKDNKISTDIHYPIPDYRQPVFDNKYKSLNLTNTEQLASEILTLPCYPELSMNDVEKIVNLINKWQL